MKRLLRLLGFRSGKHRPKCCRPQKPRPLRRCVLQVGRLEEKEAAGSLLLPAEMLAAGAILSGVEGQVTDPSAIAVAPDSLTSPTQAETYDSKPQSRFRIPERPRT